LWISERSNTVDGERLTVSGLQQTLKRLGELAGVHATPHAFRRTCALLCHRAGWRITEIQKLLGHSDLSVLRRYLDLDAEDIQAAHARYSPSSSV
jgi:integrase/recombinase XerD